MEERIVGTLHWFIIEPSRFLSFLLLLLVVAVWRDLIGRLQECEDAHLKRDIIQLNSVQLMSEQAGAMEALITESYEDLTVTSDKREKLGRRRSDHISAEFKVRAATIIDQIRAVNSEALKLRQNNRKKSVNFLFSFLPNHKHKD